MDKIFSKYSFILIYIYIYIDDILVFSKTFQEHIKHLELVFEELINNGLIVSRKKIKLFKNHIEILGLELENGQVKLQEYIVQKINIFSGKLEDLKTLQSFLGLLNYVRPYIKNLSLLVKPVTPHFRGSVDYPSTHGIQVDVGLPDATSENRAESPLYGELYPNKIPA